jgi:hypothetical protein
MQEPNLRLETTQRRALAFAVRGMGWTERGALVAALEACPVASDGEPDWRGCFVQFLRLLGADQEDAQAKTDQAFGDAQD